MEAKKKNERLLIVLVLSTSSLPSLFPLSLSRFPLFFLFFTGKMKKYVIVFRKSALSYKLSFPIRETLNEKREKKPLSFPFTSLRSPQSLALPLPPFCSRRSSAPPAAASSRSGRCSPGRESPSKPPTPGCPWRPGAAPGSSAARAPPAAGRPSRSPFPDRDADFRAVLEEAPRDAHGRARDRVDEADVGVVDRGLGYVFFLRGTRRAGEKKGE